MKYDLKECMYNQMLSFQSLEFRVPLPTMFIEMLRFYRLALVINPNNPSILASEINSQNHIIHTSARYSLFTLYGIIVNK